MTTVGLGVPNAQQLEAVLQTVPDAILTINRDGVILSANIAAEILFSCARDELLSQHISFYLPSLTLQESSIQQSAVPDRIPGVCYETQARSIDGKKISVEISVGKISSEDNNGADRVIVVRDITDRKAMQYDLELQMEKLEQSNENLASFAQIVSHDLKEPLRKILFYTKKYFLTNDNPEQRQLAGNSVYATAERMDNLISSLLKYITADKDNWFVQVKLEDVLQDVIQDLSISLQEKKASIYFGALPAVQGNPVQLRLLFQNLISNSLKFAKDDLKPVINIVSKIYNDSENSDIAIISLADNGIGFSSDYAEKIFSPFMRLNGIKKYEGTGIGLAICRKIVTHHSGVIKAHSSKGHGSEFTIILPVLQNKIGGIQNVA